MARTLILHGLDSWITREPRDDGERPNEERPGGCDCCGKWKPDCLTIWVVGLETFACSECRHDDCEKCFGTGREHVPNRLHENGKVESYCETGEKCPACDGRGTK